MKKFIILLTIPFIFSCEMVTGFDSSNNSREQDQTAEDQPAEDQPTSGGEGTNSFYPTITWQGNISNNIQSFNMNQQTAILPSSVNAPAPASNSFFDYRGITFTATHDSEVGEFAFTDGSIPGILILSTGIRNGNVSFFSGHTVEITMLWKEDSSSVYGEETVTLGYNATTAWEAPILSSSPLLASDGSDGWLIAFKEIRFIADDGVNYYTWTNPGL